MHHRLDLPLPDTSTGAVDNSRLLTQEYLLTITQVRFLETMALLPNQLNLANLAFIVTREVEQYAGYYHLGYVIAIAMDVPFALFQKACMNDWIMDYHEQVIADVYDQHPKPEDRETMGWTTAAIVYCRVLSMCLLAHIDRQAAEQMLVLEPVDAELASASREIMNQQVRLCWGIYNRLLEHAKWIQNNLATRGNTDARDTAESVLLADVMSPRSLNRTSTRKVLTAGAQKLQLKVISSSNSLPELPLLPDGPTHPGAQPTITNHRRQFSLSAASAPPPATHFVDTELDRMRPAEIPQRDGSTRAVTYNRLWKGENWSLYRAVYQLLTFYHRSGLHESDLDGLPGGEDVPLGFIHEIAPDQGWALGNPVVDVCVSVRENRAVRLVPLPGETRAEMRVRLQDTRAAPSMSSAPVLALDPEYDDRVSRIAHDVLFAIFEGTEFALFRNYPVELQDVMDELYAHEATILENTERVYANVNAILAGTDNQIPSRLYETDAYRDLMAVVREIGSTQAVLQVVLELLENKRSSTRRALVNALNEPERASARARLKSTAQLLNAVGVAIEEHDTRHATIVMHVEELRATFRKSPAITGTSRKSTWAATAERAIGRTQRQRHGSMSGIHRSKTYSGGERPASADAAVARFQEEDADGGPGKNKTLRTARRRQRLRVSKTVRARNRVSLKEFDVQKMLDELQVVADELLPSGMYEPHSDSSAESAES